MAVHSVREALAGSVAAGSEVTVRGWVRTRRDSKAGLSFVNVSDGSCFAAIQVVAPDTLGNYESEIKHLSTACAVIATGTLVPSQGQGQSFEIQATNIEVVGWVEDPLTYPMQPKQHSLEYLREYAHLRPRTNLFGAVTRIRHCMAMAIHRFFHEQEFYWVNTPIISTSDAEGAGQMFRISTLDMLNLPRDGKGGVDFSKDFFGKEAFLTVSGQLNVEASAWRCRRSIPSDRPSGRELEHHAPPGRVLDDRAGDRLRRPQRRRAARRGLPQVHLQGGAVRARRRPRVPGRARREDRDQQAGDLRRRALRAHRVHRGGVAAAEERGEVRLPGGMGPGPADRARTLADGNPRRQPVVVVNYPEQIKSFYMRLNDDGKTVAAMDVLAPGIGEIIGGSQREERLDVLDARIAQFGLDPAHYEWYRDFRRYGTVPHAGFGLGFERLLVYVCGLQNIRDAIPYPRAPGLATF
jgi:asparaginyl-tRNA synthetase